MPNNILQLVTHDGPFHTDDIFACATLSLVLENEGRNFQITRTRDQATISAADYVFDVGGVYDPVVNRFDHHQKGGAGKRLIEDVEIEYAAFGLVWKKYGPQLCGSPEVTSQVEKKLVAPIDANDNGFSLMDKKYEVSPFSIQDFFMLMRPTWNEDQGDFNVNFLKAVEIAKETITRSIAVGRDKLVAKERVTEAYQSAEDKRIIILESYYPFGKTLGEFPEPLFVIYPGQNESVWVVKAVGQEGEDFKNRKDLPLSWAGLVNEELQKVSGVSDALFCHRGLFVANAKSKEGAIKLAQIALES